MAVKGQQNDGNYKVTSHITANITYCKGPIIAIIANRQFRQWLKIRKKNTIEQMDTDTIRIIRNTESIFDFHINKNTPIVNSLAQIYPQTYINVIETHIAHRCINIHNIFSMLWRCREFGIDNCSANAFLRILSDHISTLLLIYDNPDHNEVALRHYLCIADGINSKIIEMQEFMAKDTIPDSAKDTAKETIQQEQDNLQVCIDCIKALDIYITNKTSIDNLIIKYNWRYKDISNNRSKYSWLELYREKMRIQNNYIQYLSLYVHGLAGSVIFNENQETNIQLIKAIATKLIMSFSEFLWRHFKVLLSEQEKDYLSNLLA